MQLLNKYKEIEQQIHDYFGYKEDWVVIPLDDQTGRHWGLLENERGGGSVFWFHPGVEPTLEVIKKGQEIYSGEIYTQRFLPKWVYRASGHTMVCVDTHTDGNKFLMIFDNDKEIKDTELRKAYSENWAGV